ncbi:MAG: hypothetical protein NT126_11865 [Bacteroidetes bacterium]|nr:hypothetical protein [Bacteroidota bacterium]
MNSKYFFTFLLISSFIFMLDGCQKDNNNDPALSTADRDKFLGTWITQSNGTSGPLSFTMTISSGSSSPAQIKITNFDQEGTGSYVFGDVSGNYVSLSQSIIASDTITGSGSYNSNGTLTFNYTIRDGQTVDTRTATAHK